MVEAYRRRDPEQPSLNSAFVVQVVGTLDRPGDRFLAEIVSLGASPRHSVAVRPQTLSAALDCGLDDGGSCLHHGFYSLGRSSVVGGYGRALETRIQSSEGRGRLRSNTGIH